MVKKSSKSSKKVVKEEVTPVVEVAEPPPEKVEVESPIKFYEDKFEELNSRLKEAMSIVKSISV